ncbi:MAG: 2-oxoglutarate and iron-dependent oxygenase domain-containing protein, partial [Pseudooceanicola atlanticus]
MIPILSWKDFTGDPEAFSEALGQACRETGFFLLADHPIPSNLVANVFSAADDFFALPQEEKAKLSISLNPHNRGWAQMGSESL